MKHNLTTPKKALFVLAVQIFFIVFFIKGQTNPAAQPLPYFTDFSGLPISSTTYPAGWQGWSAGTSSSTTFPTVAPIGNLNLVVGTASSTAGVCYNYNQKIGMLATGGVNPAVMMALNTSGFTNILINFDVMTIRNPYNGGANTRINQVDVQYRIGTTGSFTSFSGDVNGVYRNNTVLQTTGTTPQNSQSIFLSLPPAADNQSVVQIRWVQRDSSGAGGRPSFAVDNVSASGILMPPSIFVSTDTLPDFGSVQIGDSSTEQSYSVSGVALTDDITIFAPVGFVMSTSSGSGFSSLITLPRIGTNVPVTTIYVKFVPFSPGQLSGTFIHTSTGADAQLVFVSGTGSSCPPPVINPLGPTSFCSGGSVTLLSSPGISYVWTPNGENTASINVAASGSYAVTVDDGNGCVSTSAPVTVTVNNFSFSGTFFSESMGTTAPTVPPYPTISSYTGWQNSLPIIFSSTSTAQSDVRSTLPSNYPGASGSANVFLGTTGGNDKNFLVSGINTLHYVPSSKIMEFGIVRTAGTDSLLVEASTDGVSYIPLGKYFTVSTTNWSQVSVSLSSIPPTDNLRIRFSKNNSSSFRIDDVKISGTATAAGISTSGPASLCNYPFYPDSIRIFSNIPTGVFWVPAGSTSRYITLYSSGTHTLIATDVNGCISTDTVTVTFHDPPTATTSSVDATCYGCSDGSVSVLPSGGMSPYTVLWSTGSVFWSVPGLPAGTYTVVVTDLFGCMDTGTAVVNQPYNPPTVSAGQDQSVPAGGNAPLNGSFGGSTTSIYWTTSGTGTFSPSAIVVNAVYIPSAADISYGSVMLTIHSDSVPGYPVATDQMTITILPYPLSTAIQSVNRINYLAPYAMLLSPHVAINFSYNNQVNPTWYLNLMGYDYNTNTEFWLAQNISLDSFPGSRDLVYEANLQDRINLHAGDTLSQLGIKIFVTDSVWHNTLSSPALAYQSYTIQSIDYWNGANFINVESPEPEGPVTPRPPNTYTKTDTSRSVVRGCTMPNIDLDAANHPAGTYPPSNTFYAGDYSGCGPASASNSMQWLEARHPSDINSGLSHREKMEQLSAFMDRNTNEGISELDFLKGKLAFIDAYKLPIHVKYQSNQSNDALVTSPHMPTYGHSAVNQGKDLGEEVNHLDFDWLFEEMKNGEDVEMWLTTKRITYGNIFGTLVIDDVQPIFSSLVVLTGISEVEGVKSIDYKDDTDEGNAGGTRERVSVKIDTLEGGFPYIGAFDDPLSDPDHPVKIVTAIDGFISESYDATITFPPIVFAGSDFSIVAGGTAPMNGSFSGSATGITWSSGGSGTFTPSASATTAEYIPSAADIIAGSVDLIITSDSVPGYQLARDTMTLTILPPPANTVIYSVQRINYIQPYYLPLSQQFAINFNYLSTDTFTWHFNIMGYDYRNNTQFWIARNLSLAPFSGTRDLVYEFNLGELTSLNAGDTMNYLGIKMFVSDTLWYNPVLSPSQAYQPFQIQLRDNLIGNGIGALTTVSYPVPHVFLPVPPNPFVETDTTKSVLRGCTMPNLDLDSSLFNPLTTPNYAGDKNACAPVAVANSMDWLEQRHPDKINSGLSLRGKLEEISSLMNRQNNQPPPTWDDVVKGKLAFIDKHKLPVHVKYQAMTNNISAASIASPHQPSYGHTAENKSPHIGQEKNNIDFDWIFEEMKKGEDVEFALGTFKQPKNPDGTFGALEAVGSHMVLLTGIEVKKGVRTFDYKDDDNQPHSTGTREVVGNKYDTVPGGGYPYVYRGTDTSGNRYFSYISAVFSESLDTTIKFAPSVSAGPDKSIPAGGKAKMAGVPGGSATGIAWSSSGTGIFVPSATDTAAEYIPSAADIIAGSVDLIITSDSVPGYQLARDTMTLTILPYPAAVQLFSVQRINFRYPVEILNSTQLAINFSYLNLDTTIWHLNIMAYDYRTATQFWLAENLALHQFLPGTRELTYEPNLSNLINLQIGDTTLTQLGIKIFVTDTIWFQPVTSPVQAYQPFVFLPLDHWLGKDPLNPADTTRKTEPLPVPPNTYSNTDTTRSVIRGCTVPNIDLDSLKYNHGTDSTYAGDWNACAPAAAANSMEWLESRHPGILSSGLTHREKLKELSKAMGRTTNDGVFIKDFIAGKLEYIDKYKLPIHVKYQVDPSLMQDSSVASGHAPSYEHKAENKGKNIGENKNNIDFNWIFSEMKAGEDVEMKLTFEYRYPRPGQEDSIVKFGHQTVLSGIEEEKGVRKIHYKDDANQEDSLGTREKIVTVDTSRDGYPFIKEQSWKDNTTGVKKITWIEGIVSESYDSTITFPPIVSAGIDQTILAGQTAQLAGSFGGSATGITWGSGGSGSFYPSFFDVFAIYTPSAADIAAGSVVLTITTDAPPGYSPAQDQMILTINPAVVTLNLKVLIEGFYRGNGLMQSILYDNGLSPDLTATDSITVDLWAPVDLSAPVHSQKVIVHQDGTASVLLPPSVSGNSYYIAIRSRNAIETWSKDPVLFNSPVVSFDFTSQ